ncbi:aminotransferase class III-fold pyridoxal phosphate-dependent enzyme [Bacillus licheniformis]|nr:aminotransferase class III-fold pyridoxal phosphate-dependent enzyme [Bacillus licheniformis]
MRSKPLSSLSNGDWERTILSFHGAYHGATHGTMALSGNLSPKETSRVSCLMCISCHIRMNTAARLERRRGEPQAVERIYRNMLDDPESGVLQPAGMIFEAVQGEGGSVPARAEWIREMRRITKERGIPLIIDEVQTGIGRTGKCLRSSTPALYRMSSSFQSDRRKPSSVCRHL